MGLIFDLLGLGLIFVGLVCFMRGYNIYLLLWGIIVFVKVVCWTRYAGRAVSFLSLTSNTSNIMGVIILDAMKLVACD